MAGIKLTLLLTAETPHNASVAAREIHRCRHIY